MLKYNPSEDPDGSNLRSLVGEFLQSEFGEGKSTKDCYSLAFQLFNNWCTGRGIQPPNITYQQIAPYLSEMKEKYKLSTVKQHIAAIRTICDWLMVNGHLSANPVPQLRIPDERVESYPENKILSYKEIQKLFASFDLNKIIGLRDRAMTGLIFYAFSPITSLPQALVQDFEKTKEGAFIKTTIGDESQTIPLHETAAMYLQEYMDAAKLNNATSYLFQSTNRKDELIDHQTDRRIIHKMLVKMGKRAGLKNLNATQLRFTGIAALMQSSRSSEEIDDLIGYRTPRTQALYELIANHDLPDLHEVFDAHSNISEALQRFVKSSKIFQLEEEQEV